MAEKDEKEYIQLEDLSLLKRFKCTVWSIRLKNYEQLLFNIQQLTDVHGQFYITKETVTLDKLAGLLNNYLLEQKHPKVLLEGLHCVQEILKWEQYHKSFRKLIELGLQKFPITHQKNQILQKFVDIIQKSYVESSVFAHKLKSQHQKSVMFVIEVIGALKLNCLKKNLLDLAVHHQKACVREIAQQVANEFEDQEVFKPQKKVKQKVQIQSTKKIVKKHVKPDILQKIQSYEQMTSKQQQAFSSQVLSNFEEICLLNSPHLTNICFYIKLMIEDNNHIISTNGIKMLTFLVQNKLNLVPTSYPLLFLFRKFKLHKTHMINTLILNLVDQLLCTIKSSELMNAVLEGMNSNEKANLKYGCYLSFIKIVGYIYRDTQLLTHYKLSVNERIFNNIQHSKYIQKYARKGYEILSKQKDKQYNFACEKIRELLGLSTQASMKSISNKTQSTSIHCSKSPIVAKKRQSLFPPSKSTKSIHNDTFESPQGQLNKIIEECAKANPRIKTVQKSIEKCVKNFNSCINLNKFDLFYFCEIVDNFIGIYESREQTDEMISLFLIDCLQLISQLQVPESKRSFKIHHNGIEYLFKISVSKLILSKDIIKILDNLTQTFGINIILGCLKKVFIGEKIKSKKKNKKHILKWLQMNTPENEIDSQYYELRDCIQRTKIQQSKQQIHEVQNLQYRINKARNKHKEQIHNQDQQISPPVKKPIVPIIPLESQNKFEYEMENLSKFQNVEISTIQKVEPEVTQRLEEKWQYFLNKHGVKTEQKQSNDQIEVQEQQKFDLSDYENSYQLDYTKSDKGNTNYYKSQIKEEINDKSDFIIPADVNFSKLKQQFNEVEVSKISDQEDEKSQEDMQQIKQTEEEKQEEFQFKILNKQKIEYMLKSTTNPYSHLRPLILIPFKTSTNKHYFLSQFIFLVQSNELAKPQPFKSVLLLIVLLFSEIKGDKSLIQPLQSLYQYMAKLCSTNQFLKTLINLYHNVIEQTEQGSRTFLLTILTKSMVRLMPYAENTLQLLKDFQQFYQIGQMVYFDMFQKQYQQIKSAIEDSESLEEIIMKTYQTEGQNLKAITEGWLDSEFKKVVQAQIESLQNQQEQAY